MNARSSTALKQTVCSGDIFVYIKEKCDRIEETVVCMETGCF
jgi:hypothetical protein